MVGRRVRDRQGPGHAGFVGGAWIWILNQLAMTIVINLEHLTNGIFSLRAFG